MKNLNENIKIMTLQTKFLDLNFEDTFKLSKQLLQSLTQALVKLQSFLKISNKLWKKAKI